MTAPDLTKAQASMLDRLKAAAAHKRESGSAGWVHFTAPERQEALRELAAKGLARCWAGEGKDAGILLGEITTAGRTHP